MMANGAFEKLLVELDAALDTTLTFGQRRLGAPVWEPAASCEAASELVNTETRSSGGIWGEVVPRTAYAAANLMMHGVLDDLSSLRKLLGDPMPVIGAPILARSAIEISSTVWWLMEPGIGVRARACRELVLSLTSARRAKQVAELFDATQTTEYLQQEANVLQRIADLGLPAPTTGFSPQVAGEACKNTTALTAEMLKTGLSAAHPAESIYRVYSAVTHGEIYGLMNFMAPQVQDDGRVLLQWTLRGDVLDSTIEIAILAFRLAYERVNQIMGWGRLEPDLYSINLSKIFNSR
jgi:hypothetical protein